MATQLDYEAAWERPFYTPRPFPTPIPGAAWNDEPTYCLNVNGEWVSHLLGALEVLDQDDTWIGTDDERNAARAQVNEIMAALMQKCEEGTVAETPIRLTADGKVEIWVVDMWMPDDAQRSHDPREFIPLQRPHADDANLQRESTGVAVSLLVSLYVDQLDFRDNLDDTAFALGAKNDEFAQFIVDQVSLLGVSPNPLAYTCASKVVDRWHVARTTGVSDADISATVMDGVACELFPFVDPDTNYVTYEDWLTLKTNILVNVGNTYDSFGLWLERMLVLVGYKGLINLLSADGGTPGALGDGGGDGSYGNTHFDNTACP